METIADRITEGMTMRDMRSADLVRLSGICKSSLSMYISGKVEPKQKNINKIAKALNVNEAWLMGNDVPHERIFDIDPAYISPQRQALLDLVETATDEQIEKLMQLADIVLERRKK